MKTKIIAEIANAHGRDLEVCLELLKSISGSGAMFKVASYEADDLTIDTNHPNFSLEKSIWSKYDTLWNLYDSICMPKEFHNPIFELGKQLGVDVFSSPFSVKVADWLEENFNPPFYKIASMEAVHYPLISHIASFNKPIIVSFGKSQSLREIEMVIELIRKSSNSDITILHCISEYPTPIQNANLGTIVKLRELFGDVVSIGLSDHTDNIVVPVLAALLGASTIEKHLTLSKNEYFPSGLPNPDVKFSLIPKDFNKMCELIRLVEGYGVVNIDQGIEIVKDLLNSGAFGQEIKKQLGADIHKAVYVKEFHNEEIWISGGLRRSLIATKSIKKGDQLLFKENFDILRPGHGSHPIYLDRINNGFAAKDLELGHGISLNDIKEI